MIDTLHGLFEHVGRESASLALRLSWKSDRPNPLLIDSWSLASNYLEEHPDQTICDFLGIESTIKNKAQIARRFLLDSIRTTPGMESFNSGIVPIEKVPLRSVVMATLGFKLRLNRLLNQPRVIQPDYSMSNEDESYNPPPQLHPIHEGYYAQLDNPTSLTRHLMRSWMIAHQIYDHIPVGFLTTLDRQAVVRTLPAALLHDIGRVVSHSSEHDLILQHISQRIIANSILGTLHKPVPIDGPFDIATFDDKPQIAGIHLPGIVRLADVNGKRIPHPDGSAVLLTSPEEIRDYSLSVQKRYFDHGDPFWHGRSPQDVERYVEREAALIAFHTESWQRLFGFNWWDFAKSANEDPSSTEYIFAIS